MENSEGVGRELPVDTSILPGGASAWLSAIVNSAEDAIVGRSLGGKVVSWNPAAERMFGYRTDEILGQPISVLADPAFPAETGELTQRALNGERITGLETTRRRKDGTIFPVSLTYSLVRDDARSVLGTSKIVRDITARKGREEHIRLLKEDLEHRTKNLFVLITALLHQSQGATVPQYREAVSGRVTALANAYAAIGGTDWRSASLEGLARSGAEAFAARKDAIVLRGPAVTISPAAAQIWALSLHELCTNAMKYGALGHGGTVEITWELTKEGLCVQWRETGGPIVQPPAKEGRGLRVIRSGVEFQLSGTLRLHWEPTGFRCEIVLPAMHVVE